MSISETVAIEVAPSYCINWKIVINAVVKFEKIVKINIIPTLRRIKINTIPMTITIHDGYDIATKIWFAIPIEWIIQSGWII